MLFSLIVTNNYFNVCALYDKNNHSATIMLFVKLMPIFAC